MSENDCYRQCKSINIVSMDIIKNKEACYAAVLARDTRFDGRVFTGVSSTGIYCRPICRVKPPKAENCTFYPSAAVAESAGYRPCLKCRPELSPGSSLMDASASIASKAAVMMESTFIAGYTVADMANYFHVTPRHFNRVFHTEYGVAPSSYLRSCRLLTAKRLLTDTALPITDIAYASGFGSINRFNEQFKKYYGMTPGRLRKNTGFTASTGEITLYQGYRPPYDWEGILSFLKMRAIEGVEFVAGDVYRRTVAVKRDKETYTGWISVSHEPSKSRVAVTLSPSLAPVVTYVMARIRLLFDLDSSPELIEAKISGVKGYISGIRLPGAFDPFEMSVRTVLGQQITVKAAATLANRIAVTYGTAIETPYPDLRVIFPQPDTILKLENIQDSLGKLGVMSARSKSIYAIAAAMESGCLTLQRGVDINDTVAILKSLPGIGDWSAQYIVMRALGWPDAFLLTDYGIKKALEGHTPSEMTKIVDGWMPWRSYAMMCLWRSYRGYK